MLNTDKERLPQGEESEDLGELCSFMTKTTLNIC